MMGTFIFVIRSRNLLEPRARRHRMKTGTVSGALRRTRGGSPTIKESPRAAPGFAFGLLAIAAMPTVAALCDWGWEIAAWVSIGLMILGSAFYALTHRTRKASNGTGS